MNRPRSAAEYWRRLGASLALHGWLALAGLAAVVWLLIQGLSAVAGAALASGVESSASAEDQDKWLAAFQESTAKQVRQLEGRAMFLIPAPPAPPPPPPPEETPDRPPPPPSRYGGPAIIAMLGGSVWFEDGRVLAEGGRAERGLRVVSTSPPWTARLEWNGVEFDVTLFERTTSEFLEKPAQPPPTDK